MRALQLWLLWLAIWNGLFTMLATLGGPEIDVLAVCFRLAQTYAYALIGLEMQRRQPPLPRFLLISAILEPVAKGSAGLLLFNLAGVASTIFLWTRACRWTHPREELSEIGFERLPFIEEP